MSDARDITHLDWSRWFEGVLLARSATPVRLALMAWIAAHASSDGTGFYLDGISPSSIGYEIGADGADVERAITFLFDARLIEKIDRHDDGTAILRVRF